MSSAGEATSTASASNGSVPLLSLTAENGLEEPKLTIQFQCGLLREEETFMGYDLQIMGLDTLQEYVCDMLTFKVCGDSNYAREREREFSTCIGLSV